MERKAILLSKAQAALKSMVAGESHSPALQAIRVTRDYAEATNGHLLLRVPHDRADVGDFPTEGLPAGEGLNGETVLLAPATLDKAFKNIGVLPYVHLSLSEKNEPQLSVTDFETSATFKQRRIEGEPIDSDAVFSVNTQWQFALAAEELKRLADWALKYGGNKPIIRFSADPERMGLDAVAIEIPRPSEESATGVLATCLGLYEKKLLAERKEAYQADE